MIARDVMTPDPFTIGPNHAIGAALAKMRRGGFRRLPVVENGKLIGIITDRDLRLAMNSPYVLREGWYDSYLMEHIEVRSCMTPNPVTASATDDLIDIVELMERRKIGGLPIVEGGKLVGIITETDLLHCLIALLRKETDTKALQPA
ncbi:MAG TPA: CBS domain-containing protein [Caldilineae bacterium]|nr:CBS domain-containing protein [Caldilineae bacterium]